MLFFLRPILFSQRQALYVMKMCNEKPSLRNALESATSILKGFGPTSWRCIRISKSKIVSCEVELDENELECIVGVRNIGRSNIFDILERLEPDTESVCTVMKAESLSFELPRYALTFLLVDDNVACPTFKGWKLSPQQQLQSTLDPIFTQYILLTKDGDQILVVPVGKVTLTEKKVSIEVSNSSNLDFYVYDINSQFGTIDARTGSAAVASRLMLAGLYAASNTYCPELKSQCSGYEKAIDLLRACWVNRPLSAEEMGHLQCLYNLGHNCPSLSLLCYELYSSSKQVYFLYPSVRSFGQIDLDYPAMDAYSTQKMKGELNERLRLTCDEERVIFGSQRPQMCHSSSKELTPPRILSLIENDEKDYEDVLKSFIRVKEQSKRPFPLQDMFSSTFASSKIGVDMMSKLRSSWEHHINLPNLQLTLEQDELQERIGQTLQEAKAARLSIERCLFSIVNNNPDGFFNIDRSANVAARPSVRDLLRAVCFPHLITEFNPSVYNEDAVQDLLIRWLKLLSMELKMERLAIFVNQSLHQEIVREASECRREWSPKKHPEWLVLEVENNLQIRPLQAQVADHCRFNPGNIVQLNMGEGKTRVIIPMLVLANTLSSHVVRINVLAPLLNEAFNYLHRCLTASVLHRQLFLMPFQRQIKLKEDHVRAMWTTFERCRTNLGALCVAPEHRLSLDLKWHDVLLERKNGSKVLQAMQLLFDTRFADILDESDEILSHRYELNYAVGHAMRLPSGEVRWTVAQSLLRQLQRNTDVHKVMEPFSKVTKFEGRRSGCFDNKLIFIGEEFMRSRSLLLSTLALGLIDSPPYELQWLKSCPSRDDVVAFVTEPRRGLKWLEMDPRLKKLSDDRKDALLALRGYLAFGILEQCLSRRYRVDFGVDERRGRSRRVAVPFRACDKPSERAEYAQPDTLIFYTIMSYYNRGLTECEMKEALKALLAVGPVKQKKVYHEWIYSTQLTESEELALDSVAKLDPSNDALVSLAWSAFKFNMETINFFLSTCVFPLETMQYNAKIAANAFHLAGSETDVVMGFSGTKDTELLLPLQVKQSIANIEKVMATDGKMLQLITQSRTILEFSGQDVGSIIVQLCVTHHMDALIDAGALMAGMSNEEVASKLLEAFADREDGTKGVFYYCNTTGGWMVLGKEGRKWPSGLSPLDAKEAFVFFDESHCRGADMKLSTYAHALLTVGPLFRKDKMMQACGRLRKLGEGQQVTFAVPSEIAKRIRTTIKGGLSKDAISVNELLLWVLHNTVEMIGNGILEWGSQGIHYATTKMDEARVTREKIELKDLYGAERQPQNVAKVVEMCKDAEVSRVKLKVGEDALNSDDKGMLQRIVAHAKMFGSDVKVTRATMDEECEREIQHEREVEQEVERELDLRDVRTPTSWNYDSAIGALTPRNFPRGAGVMTLPEAIKKYCGDAGQSKTDGPPLSRIPWGKGGLFVTKNFMETIDIEAKEKKDFSDFFRPVDIFLFFHKTGEFLLVSDDEGGELLRRVWDMECGTTFNIVSFALFDYAHCMNQQLENNEDEEMKEVENDDVKEEEEEEEEEKELFCGLEDSGLRVAKMINFDTIKKSSALRRKLRFSIVLLRLFAGKTVFLSKDMKTLKDLLKTPFSRAAALKLIDLRGLDEMLSRSDLEAVCRNNATW